MYGRLGKRLATWLPAGPAGAAGAAAAGHDEVASGVQIGTQGT